MRFLTLVAILMAVPIASLAQAPEAGGDSNATILDEAARVRFQQGEEAYGEGRFGDALRHFKDAYELSGRPELLYNVASCHDRLDQRPEALVAYESFVEALPDSQVAAIARARIEVMRRGVETTPEPVDPEPERIDPEPEPEMRVNPEPDPVVEEPETEGRSLVGPIVAFSVAGVGAVVLATAGILALSRLSEAEDGCDVGRCDPALLDSVDRSALIADIGLGVAVAGAAVGVVLLLVGRKSTDQAQAGDTPRLSADVGRGRGALYLGGSF